MDKDNKDFENLIHKKDNLYCLNDIAEKLIESKNIKEYIFKIKDKKFIDGNYYISENAMMKILNKSKSAKAHQYLHHIKNKDNKKIKEIIVDDEIKYVYEDKTKHITTKEQQLEKIQTRQFVDFGKNEIIYNNKNILFFEYEDKVYFKGKDVCELLGYSNINDAISKHIDKEDIFMEWRPHSNKEGIFQDVKSSNNGKGVVKRDPFSMMSNNGHKLEKLKLDIEKKTNKFIEPNIIFINESGLYSLILSSKLPQAKQFKRWVTNDVLVSIRKTGSYNKVHNSSLYDEHKLKELENESCLYIIKVDDSLYKFGITNHSYNRMNAHKNNLNYEEIIKIFTMPNTDLVKQVENYIKDYSNKAKIRRYFGVQNEFFETNDIYTIERILRDISIIIDDELEKYNNKIKNNKLDTISFLEMKKIQQFEIIYDTEKEKTKQIESNERIILAQEKTKQMELELAILKEKSKNNEKNPKQILIQKHIRPKIKKCKDCTTMISEKSTRCTPCVNKLKKNTALNNTNRPTYKQLLEDMNKLGSYTKVGEKYKVSDNTIRKWINKYKDL